MEISGKLYLSGQSKSLPAVLLGFNGGFWLQSNSKEINLEVHLDKMVIQAPVGSLPYKMLLAEVYLIKAETKPEIKNS